jgi:tRNA dimethylallyltransferase
MSQLLAQPPPAAAGERFVRIALEPAQRSVLHERIAQRFRQMLDAGLVDEVRRLRARGDLHAGLPSMRCVGYRQVWEHLDGRYDRETMIARAIAATRQLAKRQLTWLRAMPERIPVDCLAADAFERVLRVVQEHR